MQEFFPDKTMQTKIKPSKKTLSCESCGLYLGCLSPKMEPSGRGEKHILVLAEAPGKTEDEQGTQLIGEAGQLLRRTLASMGIDLDRDCRKTNSICCRPENNREPKPREIDCCRSRVWKEIEEFKPKLILLMGNVALESFLGHRWHKNLGGIMRWRGWQIPDRDVQAWVCPVFHPSFVLRSRNNPSIENTFRLDLKNALTLLKEPFPVFLDEKKVITVCRSEEEALDWIDGLYKLSPELCAIDYETTGTKPQRLGHRIVSYSLAWMEGSAEKCIAFALTPKVAEALVSKILKNRKIGKVAHGLKFEELWSRVILNTHVMNWRWCTQIAAHVLDSREGISWLKFQVYTRFGIVDYDSAIEPFLESEEDSANGFNKIDKIPIEDLLFYNGMDSLSTLRLALIQMQEMGDLIEGYNLLHRGVLCFADLEENGIHIDEPYCKRQIKRITIQIESLLREMDEDSIIKYWRKTHKDNFNLASPVQLKHILFDHLKIKPLAYTKPTKSAPSGRPSISADTLEDYADKAPFIQDLVRVRKLTKTKDTYLLGIMGEVIAEYIYPFFKLHTVDSWRSSSAAINFQNIPRRNPEVKKWIRTAFIPRPGRMLLEVDYSQIEVCVGACYHKDPKMISYILDKKNNMHTDTAMELFFLNPQQMTKPIRNIAKSDFVFPEFYGDYYKQIAPAIWKDIRREKLKLNDSEVLLVDHLQSSGIKCYEDFETHVQEAEDRLWNKRFAVYRNWKEETIDRYYTKGYMDTLTGFRIHGPLSRNQITNIPIQSSAAHCLFWSLIQLDKLARVEKWKSKWVGQIHDSALCDVVPSELDHILKTTQRVMTKDLLEHWKWIIVPLTIEAEITEVDKSWYTKKPIELEKIK